MFSYVKLATDAGDQFLAALAEAQETFLKSMTAFSTFAPPAPAVAIALPAPKEVAEVNFAFARKLLDQQKDFAEKLIAASNFSTSAPAKSPKSSKSVKSAPVTE